MEEPPRPRWWLWNAVTCPAYLGTLGVLLATGQGGIDFHRAFVAIATGVFAVTSLAGGVLVAASDFRDGEFSGPQGLGAWLAAQLRG